MIKSASNYQTSEIFSIDTKLKYVIPKFQREYIWGKEEWDNLLSDLSDNDKGHFLGSIITINKGVDALDITPLEVIDGQQRLTTVSLLYAAIYSRFLEEDEQSDDFITDKNNLKNRLIQRGNKAALKLELSYQNNNFDDYKAILHELKIYSELHFKRPLNLGNRRIYKVYQYYKGKFVGFSYPELVRLLDKINSSLLVKIEVDNHTDAFILFESLNNRGIPLSAMDLIKNKMLAELEKKKIEKIDEAFDKWVGLIDNLPDYSTQERFLRQFYNAFRYKNKIKVEGISKATKSTLIKIYEDLIDNDTKFIFDELINKSVIYNLFIDPKNQYKEGLQSLLQIGAAPSYTVLLYLFAEHNRNEKLIQDVINFLIKYFVRRNLTDYPATRDLDKMFMDLIDKCEDAKSSISSETIINLLTKPDNFSDIKTFKEKLCGDIYEDNSDVARFILCKIEEGHQTKEIYTDLWDRDKNGKYFWTIEHVFPEGRNLPTEWVQMIANADSKKAKELQEEWVHKLGNLTLTAYNPNLSNFSFEKKRDRQDGKGKNIGYKNGLFLNKDLSNKDSWHIEDIENRTENLARIAVDMFCIDNENTI